MCKRDGHTFSCYSTSFARFGSCALVDLFFPHAFVFLISGYLYQHQDKKQIKLKEAIVVGLKSLIWPYCTFNIVIILWWLLLSTLTGTQPEESIWNIILRFLTTYGYHALWFLPTLFEVSVASKTVKCKKRWILLVTSACIGSVLSYLLYSTSFISGYWRYIAMYIGRFMIALSFVELGRYVYILDRRMSVTMEWIALIGSICISLLFYHENIWVSMVFCRMGNELLYYLNAIAGSMAIFLIAKKICASRLGKKLGFWGKNSLIVLAVHMDISIEIAWIIVGMTKINLILSFRNASVVVILIELMVLRYIVKLINRYAEPIVCLHNSCRNTGKYN